MTGDLVCPAHGMTPCRCAEFDRQRADFAYGNTKLSNDAVTREMAEQAVKDKPAWKNAIEQAVSEEREACAQLADACRMERLFNAPGCLEAGGNVGALLAKASEAERIATAIRRRSIQEEEKHG